MKGTAASVNPAVRPRTDVDVLETASRGEDSLLGHVPVGMMSWITLAPLCLVSMFNYMDRIFVGPSHEFVTRASVSMDEAAISHHLHGNARVEISGSTARSQCYVISNMVITAGAATVNLRSHMDGAEELWIVGGRYFEDWEYRSGRWAIIRRAAVHDWEQWVTSDSRGFQRLVKNTPPAL